MSSYTLTSERAQGSLLLVIAPWVYPQGGEGILNWVKDKRVCEDMTSLCQAGGGASGVKRKDITHGFACPFEELPPSGCCFVPAFSLWHVLLWGGGPAYRKPQSRSRTTWGDSGQGCCRVWGKRSSSSCVRPCWPLCTTRGVVPQGVRSSARGRPTGGCSTCK